MLRVALGVATTSSDVGWADIRRVILVGIRQFQDPIVTRLKLLPTRRGHQETKGTATPMWAQKRLVFVSDMRKLSD